MDQNEQGAPAPDAGANVAPAGVDAIAGPNFPYPTLAELLPTYGRILWASDRPVATVVNELLLVAEMVALIGNVSAIDVTPEVLFERIFEGYLATVTDGPTVNQRLAALERFLAFADAAFGAVLGWRTVQIQDAFHKFAIRVGETIAS